MAGTGYANPGFFGKVCGMRPDSGHDNQRRARRTRRDQFFSARSAVSAFFVVVVAVAAAGAQQQALTPPTDTAAVERGQQLLVQECGFCHGANARGGSGGPDLTRSVLVQNDEGGRQLGEFLQVVLDQHRVALGP